MKKERKRYSISSWYPTLADYTFPTTFVRLKDAELELIANGVSEGEDVEVLTKRISNAQSAFGGNTFVTADIVAPTDTDRFLNKKGAVYSAKAAWQNLIESKKVRDAAENKEFNFICVRPFRNMTHAREFRLFIYEGKLSLMSQYWLTRHYYRLDSKKEFYWEKAKELVDEISWLLPDKNIVLDIYFTSKDKIILIDFNVWNYPTQPLLAESWSLDWNKEYGIKLLPAE